MRGVSLSFVTRSQSIRAPRPDAILLETTMRLATLAAPFAFAILLCGPAQAAEEAYTPAAFQAAQAAGKPIIIDVVASWCPTCKAQKPTVHALLQEPKYKDFVLFNVDFDKEKQALRKFNVQQQSTILVFKGKKERARSTGETEKAPIQQLLDTAS